MVNFGVIGDDARTGALIEALVGSGSGEIIAAGTRPNPQISKMATWNLINGNEDLLAELLKSRGAEIALIGPEKFLSLVDGLNARGFKVAAPSSLTSWLELDKARLIRFMTEIGMAEFIPESRIFSGPKGKASAFRVIEQWKEAVIKPAGLTGGKGVKIVPDQLADVKEAKKYAGSLLESGETIVVQKKVQGIEFAQQAFVDKYGCIIFAPVVQDYKQLLIGDKGPNTGSMGSINNSSESLPFISESAVKQSRKILGAIIAAVEGKTGEPYIGPIYGQFMVGAGRQDFPDRNKRAIRRSRGNKYLAPA